MARPVCKGFCRDRRLISLLQRIRPRRSPPDQDGDTCAPVLINSSASCAIFNTRLPERRLTVRPSRLHPLASLHDRRFRSDRTNLYAATDTALASNGFLRCSTAQAILASLLAKATTATLRWALLISSFAHRPSGVSRSAIWGSAARAPWINCLRRYLLPRLLIPSSFGLPPVVNCLGTKPSHAARSRPWLNLSARPTAATRAEATIAPIPGIVVNRQASSFSFAQRTNSASKAAIRRSSSAHSRRASSTSRH